MKKSHGQCATSTEAGNIVLFILLAIVLIALVTAAVMSGNEGRGDVDTEALTLDASQVKQYAAELERGVVFILNNGASESDIRFANPDAPSDYGLITTTPTFQVFSPQGGGVGYKMPPAEIQTSAGPWEFYGATALPLAGSDKAELIAVLPHVTANFCVKINSDDGFGSTQPADTGTCLYTAATGRFNASTQYNDSGPNTVNNATFPADHPMLDGCVKCDDGSYHYYHVLHVR